MTQANQEYFPSWEEMTDLEHLAWLNQLPWNYFHGQA